MKMERIKLEINKNNQDKDMILNSSIQVKLPKLAITKFEDTNLDWLRFWNQF